MLTNKNKGLTLIELLLVIVLLALLSTMGIAFYQSHSTDVKVSKAALQIQQILQSATAYYIDNQCWPNTAKCSNNAPNFNNYLPINSTQIPWGGNFIYTAYGQKFRVTLNFPSTLISQQRKQLATQLLAILPTASVDNLNDPRLLMTEIARPGPSPNQNNVSIATMGITIPLSHGATTSFNFSCPANWIGKGVTAVNSYLLPKMSCPQTSYSVGSLTSPVNCTATLENNYTCTINVTHSTLISNISNCYKTHPSTAGFFSFFYIGYCVNPNAPTQQLKLF